MSRIAEAKDLMAEFPEQTAGLTWKQVADMWEDYSDSLAAGWMTPDEESVNYVFSPRGEDSNNE